MNAFTDEIIRPRLFQMGLSRVEISGGEGWNAVIENAFGVRNLQSSQQWVYTFESGGSETTALDAANKDYRVLPVDARILVDLPANNNEFLHNKLIRFWGSVDAFFNTGLEYILLDGEEIASLCLSGFVARDVHAIDIETVRKHRRKGYAEIVARAHIKECIERRFHLHWDCMAENTASARLAEKLGFYKSHEYTLYSFAME